jgi:3-dehydroquinate synthase
VSETSVTSGSGADDPLDISSHAGQYRVTFDPDAVAGAFKNPPAEAHYIVDRRVTELHAAILSPILKAHSVLLIDATEHAKSLERFPAYVEHLVTKSLRRGHVLVAIGGGIIQDITCFLAATMLRGVPWRFYPTTLLAQADSCIGSKSSINAGRAKNILGTFTPPADVTISTQFLQTLDERDVRSGVGEMLKVHAIAGPAAFDCIAADYAALFGNPALMQQYIRKSLQIKKAYIEQDEFDRGPRNVFNYGHTFGHAIESATDFAVPHGIAVTLGMDMANFVSFRMGVGRQMHFQRMHPVLRANYRGFERHPVPLDRFLTAIAKDKKNTGTGSVTLILPDLDARVFRAAYPADDNFRQYCAEFLETVRLT